MPEVLEGTNGRITKGTVKKVRHRYYSPPSQ